jgi:ATP-dependent Lon protease
MQESARAGLSFVRSRVKKLGLDENFFEKRDIHIHVPSGGQPKDGPSAGITIVTALISLISDKAVRGDLAMTGEITLRGQVLPVGGIKEKVLAAHRSGLRMVILPKDNEVDLDELPKEIRDSIEFIFADQFDDLLPVIFAEPKKKPRRKK